MLEAKRAARRVALSDQVSPTAGGIAIETEKPMARFCLRMEEKVAAEIAALSGFRLDQPILRAGIEGDRLVARLGPDEWLVVGPEAEADAIAREIQAGLSSRFFSLVDIGHRNVGIRVCGKHAADVLNAGCPIDLADASFPVGTATRTLFGKAEIVLIRCGTERYQVECFRSFAAYVHGFLCEAARDFECPEPGFDSSIRASDPKVDTPS
jgi:sarcosine oxidase, subunit gamma